MGNDMLKQDVAILVVDQVLDPASAPVEYASHLLTAVRGKTASFNGPHHQFVSIFQAAFSEQQGIQRLCEHGDDAADKIKGRLAINYTLEACTQGEYCMLIIKELRRMLDIHDAALPAGNQLTHNQLFLIEGQRIDGSLNDMSAATISRHPHDFARKSPHQSSLLLVTFAFKEECDKLIAKRITR